MNKKKLKELDTRKQFLERLLESGPIPSEAKKIREELISVSAKLEMERNKLSRNDEDV